VPQKWKDRLRVCREKLCRGLAVVRKRPSSALAIAVLVRALYAHVRIQVSKRAALKSFRELASKRRRGEAGAYHVTIVTTAALPWKTGTAVNALLRAAYLSDLGHTVSLCVPWIHPDEQRLVFPKGSVSETPYEQVALMRQWLLSHDGTKRPFEIRFYPARYDILRGSILPLGDATNWVTSGPRDLCVLEEPEHLTWYHNGANWRRAFKLVVGVVHTNYISYAQMYQPENLLFVTFINKLCCRTYTDRVVKLSDTLQPLPRAVVSNV
jgi:digalactosyldiacylglycerol synthase